MRNSPLPGFVNKPNNRANLNDARPASQSSERRLDNIQTALDVSGMTPGAGIVPDLVNVGISGLRSGYNLIKGDKSAAKKHISQAGLSLGAAIPVIGQWFGGAKLASKGSKLMKRSGAKPSELLKNWDVRGKWDPSKTMTFERPSATKRVAMDLADWNRKNIKK